MSFVATHNFSTVDQILDRPASGAAKIMAPLGHDQSRQLLRYLASEENRHYFEIWERTQLLLGIIILLVLVFGGQERYWPFTFLGIMLLAVVAQRFVLTPDIIGLGRLIDFVPKEHYSAERDKFWPLHFAYSAVEVAKWTVNIVALIYFLMVGRARSKRSVDDIDVVNKTDYGHINR